MWVDESTELHAERDGEAFSFCSEAGQGSVRPCLMTSATTILALIPVFTSVGRGSDVMTPLAIPSFGGMAVVLIAIFVVPVLYCWVEEVKLKSRASMRRPL